ncbi:hypothetical protein [Vibrio parahaemolyticus]|nr:hypothetical protein [Vibrio parahaemolyticus]MCX4134781.1 hypothetical protein [Vibrio parahaemolyticus]MCZ6386929.1 hypothetical protein [Vibrio parahaemolyticus]MDF4866604.1 hypothetical protein [Vibrio parahaemolyticus]MRE01271.1 hypothetical protein [Vibrio parahaemolyticus]QNE57599.1 hypothetical protein H5404_17355 [Vibrio parahaemolyticus]
MTDTACGFCKNVGKDIVRDLLDTIVFTLLIIGGSYLLYFLVPMPNPDGDSQFITMFSENIGPVTLMLAPILLLASMGVYLIVPNKEQNSLYVELNKRLQSLVLALRGLIIAIVGFMSLEILMVTNTPIKMSALVMGSAALVVYPFIHAVELNVKNKVKAIIGGGILTFVILTLAFVYFIVRLS